MVRARNRRFGGPHWDKRGGRKGKQRKRPEQSQRWGKNMAQNMQGTLQQPDPSKPGLHIPVRIRMDPPVEVDMPDLGPQREEDMPRGAYIMKRHFEELDTQRTARAVGG